MQCYPEEGVWALRDYGVTILDDHLYEVESLPETVGWLSYFLTLCCVVGVVVVFDAVFVYSRCIRYIIAIFLPRPMAPVHRAAAVVVAWIRAI